MVVIETAGAIEQVELLKAAYSGDVLDPDW
jgi:hypothetical protein